MFCLRHTNLTLLQSYGSNAWRIQNYLTEATAKNVERSLEDLQNLVTEVNRDRKNFQVRSPSLFSCWFSVLSLDLTMIFSFCQTRLGDQITSLETRWTELISSILQIEMANIALEVEIDRLNRKEADLAAGL